MHVDPEVHEDESTQRQLIRVLSIGGRGGDGGGRMTETGPRFFTTAPSDPIHIEGLIREAVMTKVPGVVGVTHVAVHVFKSGITTEVTIEVRVFL